MHKIGTRFLFSSPRSLVPKGEVQFASYKEETCITFSQDGIKNKFRIWSAYASTQIERT